MGAGEGGVVGRTPEDATPGAAIAAATDVAEEWVRDRIRPVRRRKKASVTITNRLFMDRSPLGMC
jgi:hypothetical protein